MSLSKTKTHGNTRMDKQEERDRKCTHSNIYINLTLTNPDNKTSQEEVKLLFITSPLFFLYSGSKRWFKGISTFLNHL